jgi:transcriptional regulator with XRE-family HTH domain
MRTKDYSVRGSVIRELRLRKLNWMQEELAEAAGLSSTHLSRLENGHHQPQLSTVKKLAAVLGVEMDVLIEWHIG